MQLSYRKKENYKKSINKYKKNNKTVVNKEMKVTLITTVII